MSVWNGRYYGKNVSGLAKSHKSVAWGSGEDRDITLCRISEEADGLIPGVPRIYFCTEGEYYANNRKAGPDPGCH